MIRKLLITICFIMSLAFALVPLQNTAAISSTLLERAATAVITDDNKSHLKLEGLDASKIYTLNNSFTKVGTITNNSKRELQLTVLMTPDPMYSGSNYRMGLKIGVEEIELRKHTNPTQIFLTLDPGQTLPIEAKLTNNHGNIHISFQFIASDSEMSYFMYLLDTERTPRRIICN